MKSGSSIAGRVWSHPIVVTAAVLCAASLIAVAIGMPIDRVTQIAIYTLYGAGVNFLIGYLGLVPFGASFFFGCASYALAIAAGAGWSANEVTGIVSRGGVFRGARPDRRRGHPAPPGALLLAPDARLLADRLRGRFKWTAVTGGENGLQNVDRPLFPSPIAFHVFTLAVVLGVLWLLWRVAHAPFGRLMQALRDNEQRVASLGYDTYLTKLVAFTIAGTPSAWPAA